MVGVPTCLDTVKISAEILQIAENSSAIRFSYITLGHIPKGLSYYCRDTCSSVFPDALFITAEIGNIKDDHEVMTGQLEYLHIRILLSNKENEIMKISHK